MMCPWTCDPCREKCPNDELVKVNEDGQYCIAPAHCEFRRNAQVSGDWSHLHFKESQNG